MTDSYKEPEAQQILPGELADNKKIQEAYIHLNTSLQEKMSNLKQLDPTKHYFHSKEGNHMTSEGGKEIEIAIIGSKTTIKFDYRGKSDDSDPKALERVNAVSLILISDIISGKQTADLEIFRDGNKHAWKAQSFGSNHEISFQQTDCDSHEIVTTLQTTTMDCLSLLSKPDKIESAEQPPKNTGLMILPDKKSQARWN